MIVVKLWGGLCNQMFQYAFAYSLKKKYHEQLVFDAEFYKNQPSYVDRRELQLTRFFPNIKLDFIETPSEIKLFENRLVNKIVRVLKINVIKKKNIYFIKEPPHKFIKNIPFFPAFVNYYDGYWQSDLYFIDQGNELKTLFQPPADVKKRVNSFFEKLPAGTYVSIHVRRGDMRKKQSKRQTIKDILFFEKSMLFFEKKVNNPVFIVCSDDIDWCMSYLPKTIGTIVFCKDNCALDDLFIIANSDHSIMSASTFSWWGNWLSEKKNRIIIAPKGSYFNDCFFPDGWNLIRK